MRRGLISNDPEYDQLVGREAELDVLLAEYRRTLEGTGRPVLILGEPGIGKTATLERFAWELASGDLPVVPVFIKLLEYDGQPLIDWVRLA